MKTIKNHAILVTVLSSILIGGYLLLQKNNRDIATQKNIIAMSEEAIARNFSSKEQLQAANFSIYKNNNEISEETKEILTSVKHLRSFQLQVGVFKIETSKKYTINDEFSEGLKNAKSLIKAYRNQIETEDTLETIKKNLRIYNNAYYRLEYPADSSKDESFKQVFQNLAALYHHVEGKEIERHVLYVMADCADKIENMNFYMVAPVLLTKIIRDNPQDELSRKAWILLNTYMRDSFTGSTGENTPSSWKSLISDLAVMVAGSR